MFRLAARTIPRRRSQVLSYSGPVLVAMNVALWILLLAVGFAFIAWPVLGSAIRASHGPIPQAFATALYYSGYALTTLGTGDLVAKTALYRPLMVVESATGFATITLILTYFLVPQPYTSLPRLFLVALDTAALLQAALHPAAYQTVIDSAAVAELWCGGLHVLHELTVSFLPREPANQLAQYEQEW